MSGTITQLQRDRGVGTLLGSVLRRGTDSAARATPFEGTELATELAREQLGAAEYEARDRAHVLRRLRQRAENLGFGLVDLKTGEVADGTVS